MCVGTSCCCFSFTNLRSQLKSNLLKEFFPWSRTLSFFQPTCYNTTTASTTTTPTSGLFVSFKVGKQQLRRQPSIPQSGLLHGLLHGFHLLLDGYPRQWFGRGCPEIAVLQSAFSAHYATQPTRPQTCGTRCFCSTLTRTMACLPQQSNQSTFRRWRKNALQRMHVQCGGGWRLEQQTRTEQVHKFNAALLSRGIGVASKECGCCCSD